MDKYRRPGDKKAIIEFMHVTDLQEMLILSNARPAFYCTEKPTITVSPWEPPLYAQWMFFHVLKAFWLSIVSEVFWVVFRWNANMWTFAMNIGNRYFCENRKELFVHSSWINCSLESFSTASGSKSRIPLDACGMFWDWKGRPCNSDEYNAQLSCKFFRFCPDTDSFQQLRIRKPSRIPF